MLIWFVWCTIVHIFDFKQFHVKSNTFFLCLWQYMFDRLKHVLLCILKCNKPFPVAKLNMIPCSEFMISQVRWHTTEYVVLNLIWVFCTNISHVQLIWAPALFWCCINQCSELMYLTVWYPVIKYWSYGHVDNWLSSKGTFTKC